MTELEIAVAAWKSDYENAPMLRHPQVWVGHYEDTSIIGSVFGPTNDEIGLAFMLMSPFGMSKNITDTFIALDRTSHAWFTRLSARGNGVQITDWRVDYSYDRTLTIHKATKAWHPNTAVRRAADLHSHRRLTTVDIPFVVTFGASVQLGERHATQR